jgi:hypothetical protein
LADSRCKGSLQVYYRVVSFGDLQRLAPAKKILALV